METENICIKHQVLKNPIMVSGGNHRTSRAETPEFREAGTIRTYRYSCISFCCFLISKGFKNFESLSPAIIKEYAVRDKHKTFKEELPVL